ncbi:hypothetical protein AB0K18_40815 [Nonomuraea sp. NPDC049421]|uniref:hypothetical protein n=1 Tax=Nonomuraea sp. NPDC049421 TaxID=3155275 RepID=UPI003445385D
MPEAFSSGATSVAAPVGAQIKASMGVASNAREPSWEPTPASRERFRALLAGVVAFRVHVRSVQAMFKLSQDIDAERYERVRADFAADNPRLADLMDK